MRGFVKIVTISALCVPIVGFAADEPQDGLSIGVSAEIAAVAVPESSTASVGLPPAGVLISDAKGAATEDVVAAPEADASSLVALPKATVVNAAVKAGDFALEGNLSIAGSAVTALETAAQHGDFKAAVDLAVKYAHAEGVPRDQGKANQLFCSAARYGYADALFNLGWVYANGRGVVRDDTVAAILFRRAADRGHTQATKLLGVVQLADENQDVKLPECLLPRALPVAVLPPAPPVVIEPVEAKIPMAPKEIIQLVNRLAPQFEIDANLALAVIYAESAFNVQALSSANAQGLMQLIPETAERFGVKNTYKPDENIKGGLAYLRWLLAYFQGDVSLALAGYNAGEGAVEKHRGIPPYNETRDYVKKITAMYRRLTHPYNPGVVKPSPVMSQIKSSVM